MKRYHFYSLLLFFLSLFPSFNRAYSSDLFVIQTGDVQGELKPCGCQGNPLGGIPRLSKLIEITQSKNPKALVLFLDSGNLLFRTKRLPEVFQKVWLKQAQELSSFYQAMNVAALLPGPLDLSASSDFLKGLSLPWVISNTTTQQTFFLKKKDFALGDTQVSIFGIASTETLKKTSLKKMEIKKMLSEWKKSPKESFLILLSNQGLEEDKKILSQMKPLLSKKEAARIALFGGGSISFLEKPDFSQQIPIFNGEEKNHHVWLTHFSHNQGQWSLAKSELIALDSRFDLEKSEQLPKTRALLSRFQKAEKEIDDLNLQISNTSTTHSLEKEPLWSALNCKECHEQQFLKWKATPHASAYFSLLMKELWKNAQCLSCHSTGLAPPDGDADPGRVFLKEDGSKDKDAQSKLLAWLKESFRPIKELPRHSTKPFTPILDHLHFKTKKSKLNFYGGVQCLACHQEPSSHPFEDSSHPRKQGASMRSLCLNCHTKSQHPDLYDKKGQLLEVRFQKMWKKVSH